MIVGICSFDERGYKYIVTFKDKYEADYQLTV